MSSATRLIDLPDKFLDQEKWAQVRALASNKLEALSYLNAPFPNSAADFFWYGNGSDLDARRFYELGKSLVEESRSLFLSGRLVASGLTRQGIRQSIPSGWWIGLYPLFATDRIVGRTQQFIDIEVIEVSPSIAAAEQQLMDCIAWLKVQRAQGSRSKKILWHDAQRAIGCTKRTFEAAYKAVFDSPRGHPKD
jgi:hypothetical protein